MIKLFYNVVFKHIIWLIPSTFTHTQTIKILLSKSSLDMARLHYFFMCCKIAVNLRTSDFLQNRFCDTILNLDYLKTFIFIFLFCHNILMDTVEILGKERPLYYNKMILSNLRNGVAFFWMFE